jgi:hypothetical protein
VVEKYVVTAMLYYVVTRCKGGEEQSKELYMEERPMRRFLLPWPDWQSPGQAYGSDTT